MNHNLQPKYKTYHTSRCGNLWLYMRSNFTSHTAQAQMQGSTDDACADSVKCNLVICNFKYMSFLSNSGRLMSRARCEMVSEMSAVQIMPIT